MHHPLSAHHRGTVFHLTRNYFPATSIYDLPLILDETPAAPIDRPIAERLINIFHRTIEAEAAQVPAAEQPRAGVWEMVRHEFHGPAYRLLEARDVPGFAAYMRNAMRTSLCYGLGVGEPVFNAFIAGGDPRRDNVAIVVDRLVSLGVAIGALAEETSEQGHYGENMQLSLAELVGRIQQRLGVEIWRPPVMGSFGLAFDGHVVDARVAEDAYCAHRVKDLCAWSRSSIAEIGGGFGGMAMQLVRAGAGKVVVFDLPLISLVQGWYLMKVFGPDAVGMLGEACEGRPLVLLPYWEFTKSADRFGLVFNRDSMPEMPPQAALAYIDEMARRRVPFLSVNQETENESGQPGLRQGRVASHMQGKPFVRRYRFPYWIRKGYVEEFYEPA